MTELSSSFYRDLLEFAPDALVVVNARGTIIYANAPAHCLFGYDAGTLPGAAIEHLIPRQSRAKHTTRRNECEMGSRSMPVVDQRRYGSRFRAETRLARIRAVERIGSAAAARDATENDRIVTMMATAKETADEANATKGRFLAAASHDLRQPLQTLRLLNGTLKRLATDSLMREVLDQEDRAISTMSELLNALLNVTKLESGTVQPTIAVVTLDEIFDGLRQQFASPAKLKKLNLEVVSSNLCLRTDSTLLREMLQNLLANAIRYTDEGRVALGCRREQGRTWIEVEDTGVGMSEEIQEKIFDDFFQAAGRGATHRGGVGLGLGIVRRLSQMLQLPVEVSSVVGVGTRFSVDVTTAIVARTMEVESAVARSTPQAQRRGQRILLVEDEEAMRNALRTYLLLDDHVVSMAESLCDLDKLLEEMALPPDIVISDFHLGERERGSEAIERVRVKFGDRVPAIVLTGDTSLVPARLFDQPATRMLHKPIDCVVLTAIMDGLLQQRAN